MNVRLFAIAVALVILCGPAAAAGASDDKTQATPAISGETADAPAAMLPDRKYEFEPVVDGAQVTHDFVIKNEGKGLLEINKVKTG